MCLTRKFKDTGIFSLLSNTHYAPQLHEPLLGGVQGYDLVHPGVVEDIHPLGDAFAIVVQLAKTFDFELAILTYTSLRVSTWRRRSLRPTLYIIRSMASKVKREAVVDKENLKKHLWREFINTPGKHTTFTYSLQLLRRKSQVEYIIKNLL